LHAAVLQAHALAAAEIEPAVGEMQIAVADAGGDDLQQHLGAGGRGRGIFVALKRLAADADLEATHGSSPPTLTVIAREGGRSSTRYRTLLQRPGVLDARL